MPDFSAYCSSVVKEYVNSVLMIDDQAGMGESLTSVKPVVKLPTPPQGLGGKMFAGSAKSQEEVLKPVSVEDKKTGHVDPYKDLTADYHLFDAHLATSSFYKHGIVAGLYKPVIDETITSSDFAETSKIPALKSDVIIVDWMLKKNSPDYSKELIRTIVQNDIENGGRLRVIIVYTGEQYLGSKRDDLFTLLDSDQSIEVSKYDDYEIHAKNLIISFYNKPRVLNPDGRSISPDELPRVSIEEFSKLVDGIVPAFAMKAAGTIRQNSGRIISRFGKELDSAYLSHRVLLPQPEDAEVFMLENFVSYMRNILAIGRVDNLTLGDRPIEHWIRKNERLLNLTIAHGDDEYKFDIEDIIRLSKNGFHDNLYEVLEEKKNIMAKPYKDANKEPSLKAITIFDRDIVSAAESSVELSILSVFRRTFKDVVDKEETPYLTQGTLIYSKDKDRFLLCITPKCDTVRIKYEKKFSFAILDEVDGKKFDMVIPFSQYIKENKDNICKKEKEEILVSIVDSSLSNTDKLVSSSLREKLKILKSKVYGDYVYLSTSPKFYTLEHIIFESDNKQRVPGNHISKDLIEFWDQECAEYIWIGDLHDLNTISRVSKLVTNLNRTGIDELEWLRRQYQ